MSKLSFVIVVAWIMTAAQAFVPAAQIRTPAFAAVSNKQTSSSLNMADYLADWDSDYPPSSVLGPVMSKMPSGVLGVLSLVFLTLCAFSCFQSAELYKVPELAANGGWVKWYYVLGSFGGPLSWGTHVAAWIQRKNGVV